MDANYIHYWVKKKKTAFSFQLCTANNSGSYFRAKKKVQKLKNFLRLAMPLEITFKTLMQMELKNFLKSLIAITEYMLKLDFI